MRRIWEAFRGDGEAAGVAVRQNGRGHDLYTGIGESVEHVAAQGCVALEDCVGCFAPNAKLVIDGIIVEALFHHPGWRIGGDLLGAGGCVDEQLVDDSPIDVVADGDGDGHGYRVPCTMSAVVGDGLVQHFAVGDADLLIAGGYEAGDEESFFRDTSVHAFNLHHVSYAEGTGVGEEDACEEIADCTAGSKGYECADEEREAAKERGACSGQVGKAHHENEEEEDGAAEFVGGVGPIGGKMFEDDGAADEWR